MPHPEEPQREAPGALRADSLPEPVSPPPGAPGPTTVPGADVVRDAGGRRRYSGDVVAFALAHLEANGGNLLQTSEALGIPLQTLGDWRNGARPLARSPEIRNRIRQQLAERARGVADRMLTRLETADLETVGVRDAAIVFGIVTEKSLLLDGEATQITETRSGEAEEKASRIRDRYSKRRKLVPVQTTDPGAAPVPTEEPKQLPGGSGEAGGT